MKRFTSLIITLALALSFTSCADLIKRFDDSSETEETTSTTTRATEPSSSHTTRSSRVSDDDDDDDEPEVAQGEIIDLSGVDIMPIADQIYSGVPINVLVDVYYGEYFLDPDYYYYCTYYENVTLGTATVTVNGNGVSSTGSTSATFNIITGDPVCDSLQNRGVVDFVERVYDNALNRYPDINILVNYVNALVSTETSAPTFVNAIYNSTEFMNRQLSDSDFLTSVYRGVLNREPDEAGFSNNLSMLTSGAITRNNLVNNMLSTPEFITLCGNMGVSSEAASTPSTPSTPTTPSTPSGGSTLADGTYQVRIDYSDFYRANSFSSAVLHFETPITLTTSQVNSLRPGSVIDISGNTLWYGDTITVEGTPRLHTGSDGNYVNLSEYGCPDAVQSAPNSDIWYIRIENDYILCRDTAAYTVPVSSNVSIYEERLSIQAGHDIYVNSFADTSFNYEEGWAECEVTIQGGQITNVYMCFHP